MNFRIDPLLAADSTTIVRRWHKREVPTRSDNVG